MYIDVYASLNLARPLKTAEHYFPTGPRKCIPRVFNKVTAEQANAINNTSSRRKWLTDNEESKYIPLNRERYSSNAMKSFQRHLRRTLSN